MDYKRFKYELFKAAQKQGFKEFELYYTSGGSLRAGVFKGELDTYDSNTSCGAGFRGKINGKMGYAYTEILDGRSVDMLVTRSKENAEITDEGDEEFIYMEKDTYKTINAYNPKLESIKPTDVIGKAMDMEKRAFECDSRVDNVRACSVSLYKGSTRISNSYGLDMEYTTNGVYGYAIPVVRSGEDVRTAVAYRVGRRYELIDPNAIADEAVERAISYLGAGSVDSGSYKAVICNEAAADMLDVYSGIFSAEKVQKGLSLLKGKLGEKVASGIVTIVDNPLMENGMCGGPFDCEGVATGTKEVVTCGVLNTYLYNLKTAHKDDVGSTGNAARGSYSSRVGTAPSNFYIKPGDIGYEELLGYMDDGLLITELEGLHSGANAVSGDFSLAAKGFLVKSGKMSSPVEQITIAGNIFELLKSVTKVGNDIKFGFPSPGGCFGSPSILIDKLSVAGR